MNYFIIDSMPLSEKKYCFLGDTPRSILNLSYRMARGIAMGKDYPRNPLPEWHMSPKHKGIKLPSLIANTHSMLVVDRALKEIFENTGVDMECLPFVLLDHKGRVASTDYFIINPLGNLDCLNLEKSEIEWLEGPGSEVVGIEMYVLDTEKVKDAPDVFRIKHDREQIIISHQLADRMKKVKPTNVYLIDLEQAPPTEQPVKKTAQVAKMAKTAKSKG